MGYAMEDLRYSIFGLLQDAAIAKGAKQNMRFMEAASNVLDAMKADGLICQDSAWVYEAMMRSMVQSGAFCTQDRERALLRRSVSRAW
jgi:hypothetical protein